MPHDQRSRVIAAAKRTASFVLLATVANAAAPETPPGATAPWPEEKSPAPSAAAWAAASALPVKRTFGAKASACAVLRLAEWVRIRCPELKTAAITELAGSEADVSYHIEPPGDDRVPGAGHVTFRARRGDRRVFLFWTLGPGYDGPLTVIPAVVVQESFQVGSNEPVLTLNDALHEPVGTATHPRPPPW